MQSRDIKLLMAVFLTVALGCGYSTIIIWDGPIFEKVAAMGGFSGAICGVLFVVYLAVIQEDTVAIARVNAQNLADKAALEAKQTDADIAARARNEPQSTTALAVMSKQDITIVSDEIGCRKCGRTNYVTRSVCWFCNNPLDTANIVVCPHCKAANDVSHSIMWQNGQDSVFCANCKTTKLPKKKGLGVQASPTSGV